MSLTLIVNGKSHTLDVDPSTPLLYVLRNDLGLQGPRFGCGLGQCGACTVIVNGVATRSCIIPASTREKRRSRRSKGSPGTASCIRYSRPGSTSRFRSAASVKTGRS